MNTTCRACLNYTENGVRLLTLYKHYHYLPIIILNCTGIKVRGRFSLEIYVFGDYVCICVRECVRVYCMYCMYAVPFNEFDDHE